MFFKNIKWKNIFLIISFLGIIELLSFLSFLEPVIALPVFTIISLSFLFLSIYRIDYALGVIFSELIIGSMGHLFYLDLGPRLSIRIVFFLLISLVFLVKFAYQFYRDRNNSVYFQRLRSFVLWKPFVYLAIFVGIGLINSLVRATSFSLVFQDFNAWLFFFLIFPCLAVLDLKKKKSLDFLINIILASLIFLSLKTLFLLAIFFHNSDIASGIYSWLRLNLLAEITINNFWSRIFLQSQIFSGAAILFTLFMFQAKEITSYSLKYLFKKDNLILLLLSALFFSTILLSLSRSFWLALALVLLLSVLYIWRFIAYKKLLQSLLFLFTSVIVGIFFVYLITILPISESKSPDFTKILSDRISQDSSEAAIASRWSLLPVLAQEIKTAPFFGKGFGYEISYISSDPRVLEKDPSGEYRTFAFEWGYLDTFLKIGFFGLLSYLLIIFRLIHLSLKKPVKEKSIALAASAVIMFLAVVNFFTPYLNHPLGISLLILMTCIIQENRLYLKTNKQINK